MIKLKLNPKLGKNRDASLMAKAITAEMAYQTFHRMVRGDWNPRALYVLARFLIGNGYTAEQLNEVKFSDIFIVEDVVDGK